MTAIVGVGRQCVLDGRRPQSIAPQCMCGVLVVTTINITSSVVTRRSTGSHPVGIQRSYPELVDGPVDHLPHPIGRGLHQVGRITSTMLPPPTPASSSSGGRELRLPCFWRQRARLARTLPTLGDAEVYAIAMEGSVIVQRTDPCFLTTVAPNDAAVAGQVRRVGYAARTGRIAWTVADPAQGQCSQRDRISSSRDEEVHTRHRDLTY